MGILAINPVAFEAIAPQITEQLLEGLAQQYAVIIAQSARLFLNAGFLNLYGFLPARIISVTQTGTNSALSTAVASIINPYTVSETEFGTKTTAEKASLISGVHKFKFAKLSIKQLVTAATEKKASRITGRLYYRNVTNTVTTSFGKIIASDTYATVCAAIEAEAAFVSLTTGTNKNNHFRFIPEQG